MLSYWTRRWRRCSLPDSACWHGPGGCPPPPRAACSALRVLLGVRCCRRCVWFEPFRVVVPRARRLCDPRGPRAGNHEAKLGFGKMAFREPDKLVGTRVYYILAVGLDRGRVGDRCLRRVHERRVVRKPFHPGARQYLRSESCFGLQGGWWRAVAARG